MRVTIRLAFAAVVLLLSSASMDAQWVNYPTPGTPRLPDGKPNLNAAAPKTADGKPDLSGIWTTDDPPKTSGYFMDLALDLQASEIVMTPWAKSLQEQRERRVHVDDPYGYCLPPGVPRILVARAPFKIIQTSAETVMLFETIAAQTFREVFTDGRPALSNPEPTWLGYALGKWEGDTFVVETSGFRDGGWLDTAKGRPHSDALHVTERFTRPAFGRMEAMVTINDPKAYVKPWTARVKFKLIPDTSLLEIFCTTHRETMEHRSSESQTVVEPPSPR